MDITFFQIGFLSVWVCVDSSPLDSLFILEALWLLGETSEEDEGNTEQPEMSTLQQTAAQV